MFNLFYSDIKIYNITKQYHYLTNYISCSYKSSDKVTLNKQNNYDSKIWKYHKN